MLKNSFRIPRNHTTAGITNKQSIEYNPQSIHQEWTSCRTLSVINGPRGHATLTQDYYVLYCSSVRPVYNRFCRPPSIANVRPTQINSFAFVLFLEATRDSVLNISTLQEKIGLLFNLVFIIDRSLRFDYCQF